MKIYFIYNGIGRLLYCTYRYYVGCCLCSNSFDWYSSRRATTKLIIFYVDLRRCICYPIKMINCHCIRVFIGGAYHLLTATECIHQELIEIEFTLLSGVFENLRWRCLSANSMKIFPLNLNVLCRHLPAVANKIICINLEFCHWISFHLAFEAISEFVTNYVLRTHAAVIAWVCGWRDAIWH